MIILGIDPGSSRVGYGVIEKNGSELRHITSGLFTIPKMQQAKKLANIQKEFKKIIENTRPSQIGVEKLFFFKNKKTVIEVAEARGAILAVIGDLNIPFVEITPLQVKRAVTGNGNATKEAVAKMVRYFLKSSPAKIVDDVSDALAIAIAASQMRLEKMG